MLARQDGIAPAQPQADLALQADDPRWLLRGVGPALENPLRITGYPDHHQAFESLWRSMDAAPGEVEWTLAVVWVSVVLLEWVEVVERSRGQKVVRRLLANAVSIPGDPHAAMAG